MTQHLEDRSRICKFFFPDGTYVEIPLQDIDHYHQLVRVMQETAKVEAHNAVESLKFRMMTTIDSYNV